MEEALEILWTYARRQAIDCNGKVVIPTINQSIAAIRLIIRLEGARKNNEKKVKSKASENLELGMWVNSKASENLELGHRREEQKVIREERRVINVADYTAFEEEEEEEDVSPFAPFLLDEDDWSCSADNQLPKETPLSTIHYPLKSSPLLFLLRRHLITSNSRAVLKNIFQNI